MADGELVQLERRDDGVAVVRLDNPKVNAVSTALLRERASVGGGLRDDPPDLVIAMNPLYRDEIAALLRDLGVAAPVEVV